MRVIIHFNKNSRIREFSRTQVYSLILLISFVFIGLLATVISLAIHNSSASVFEENKKLRQTIKELTNKIDQIQNSLSKVYETEKKLKLAAGIDWDFEYGTGGADEINIKSIVNSKDNDIATLNKLTNELISKVKFQQEKFNLLVNKLNEKEELAKRIPAIVPMDGVFSDHSFGMRVHPVLKVWRMHEGIDINGVYGAPVYATGAGVVKFVGWNGGLGLCVTIDHGFGYETTYGHLSKATVREGQKVTRFQKIGECGSTGLSTGPHLHYEVSFNGEKQNPVYYFFK